MEKRALFEKLMGRKRKQLVVLASALAILAASLALRLSVTLSHWLPLGRDGPYNFFHSTYLLEHYPSLYSNEVPAFFHFAAWVMGTLSALGVDSITAFDVATALASGLVAITTFLMMRRLTGNPVAALLAAFFASFLPADLRMMGELQKNAFGVTLAPISLWLLWSGMESGRKLTLLGAGLALGAVGLTHQLVFGTLVIAYASFLGLLLVKRRRIPWFELRCAVVVAAGAALVCGWFYSAALSGAESLAGDAGEGMAPEVSRIYQLYGEYIGPLLLALSAVGLGICTLRGRRGDLLLMAWWLSAFAMAQPWVERGYEWRFAIMFGVAAAPLAAVGLSEIIRVLWEGGRPLARALGFKISARWKQVGRATAAAVVLGALIIQTSIAYEYAWRGEMLQPLITREQYAALVEFRESFGEVYVFGPGEALGLYWPDAVGLIGAIQGGDAVRELSELLRRPKTSAEELVLAWKEKEQQVNAKIYALTDRPVPVLESEQHFEQIFAQGGIKAYALRGDWGDQTAERQLFVASPPPDERGSPSNTYPEGEASLEPLQLLLLPIHVLSGWSRFLIGVPLTVTLWALAVSLGWTVIQRAAPRRATERVRLLAAGAGILVVAAGLLSLVQSSGRGQFTPFPPAGGVPPEESPPGGAPILLTARSSDGLEWVKTYRVLAERASVPDAIFDGENVRVYYSKWDGGLGVLVSADAVNWIEREVRIEGLPSGRGAVDPDVVLMPDGSYRLYYYEPPLVPEDPALIPGKHVIALAVSEDGYFFTRVGESFAREWVTDPDVVVVNGEWRMFVCTYEERIYSAVSRDGGFTFEFEGELPVRGIAPSTIGVEDGYRMYYHRGPEILSAFSPDGIEWTEEGPCLGPGSAGELDEHGVGAPAVVRLSREEYLMVYQTWPAEH